MFAIVIILLLKSELRTFISPSSLSHLGSVVFYGSINWKHFILYLALDTMERAKDKT